MKMLVMRRVLKGRGTEWRAFFLEEQSGEPGRMQRLRTRWERERGIELLGREVAPKLELRCCFHGV